MTARRGRPILPARCAWPVSRCLPPTDTELLWRMFLRSATKSSVSIDRALIRAGVLRSHVFEISFLGFRGRVAATVTPTAPLNVNTAV